MDASKAKQRAVAAHERNWGKSLLPIKASFCDSLNPRLQVGGNYPAKWIRTVDHESGTIIDWDYSGWRLRRIAEQGPA